MRQARTIALCLVVTVIAVLSVGPARAAGSLDLSLDARAALKGQVVSPGDYKLVWKDDGAGGIDVSIRRGGKIFAQAKGVRAEIDTAPAYDGVRFKADQNGIQEIVEIQVSGKKEAIRIE